MLNLLPQTKVVSPLITKIFGRWCSE